MSRFRNRFRNKQQFSVLTKDGTTTYFVGADNYRSHPAADRAGQRFAIATIMLNGHVRPCEVEASPLGIPRRTLMNWKKQLSDLGSGSFFGRRNQRGESVMTPGAGTFKPEVRTLRKKIALISGRGKPQEWMKDLSAQWMAADPLEAGYLYVDGHARVYHGEDARLPKRFVSREKLCLRGTADYWVNDALGRPFFVVSRPLTGGKGPAAGRMFSRWCQENFCGELSTRP